jgi:hypothetical protein
VFHVVHLEGGSSLEGDEGQGIYVLNMLLISTTWRNFYELYNYDPSIIWNHDKSGAQFVIT